MESTEPIDGMNTTFCIGHHESKRPLPVSPQVVRQAQDCNYDMLTSPITTPHFHSRVLTAIASHLSQLQPVSYGSSNTLASSHNTSPLTISPLAPVDTPLTPSECSSQILAVASPWIDLCSPDPLIADVSSQILMLEVAYAAFCGVSYLLVPGPRLHNGSLQEDGLMQYARVIQEALKVGPYIQLQIWLPMIDHPDNQIEDMGDLAPFARPEYMRESDMEQTKNLDIFGTWDAWNIIRTLCKYHSRLCVALSLPRHFPPVAIQSRWHSEPVRLLTIDATSFLTNQKGYPVLSKAHQALIIRYMRLRSPPWFLLCDVGPIPGLGDPNVIIPMADGYLPADATALDGASFPTPAEAAKQKEAGNEKKHQDPTPHLSYMRNLQLKQPPQTPIERFGAGYQDYLQAPLQPLTVNLESITYEVFEKDPIKYEWYERAIASALRDWVEQGKPTSNPNGRVVVAVVGAGRGPLVSRALRASEETGVAIDLWALEKNPNAYVLLQNHNESRWSNRVKLVKSDMRTWRGPWLDTSSPSFSSAPIGQAIGSTSERQSTGYTESFQASGALPPSSSTAGETPDTQYMPIDILISELLGSFADNELSPECLDGVTHLLNPTHGISIPASYTAHITPITAPKLHAGISAQAIANPAAPETPYVVMLHAVDFLSSTTATSTSAQPLTSPTASGAPQYQTPPSSDAIFPVVQTAWSFTHPNPHAPPPMSATPSNLHNVRHTSLTFSVRDRGVCHGLAGYFETVLYGDVELSTNPVTMEAKSPGMISWFPIFFPLKTPMYVPDNAGITINMWRQTDDRKVWYEWIVEVFTLEKVRGSSETAKEGKKPLRRVRLGISELHSSIKEGCLM